MPQQKIMKTYQTNFYEELESAYNSFTLQYKSMI